MWRFDLYSSTLHSLSFKKSKFSQYICNFCGKSQIGLGRISASTWLYYCIFPNNISTELCTLPRQHSFLKTQTSTGAYLLCLECKISQRLRQRRPTGQRPSSPLLLRTWSLPSGAVKLAKRSGSCQGLCLDHSRLETQASNENQGWEQSNTHSLKGNFQGRPSRLPLLMAPCPPWETNVGHLPQRASRTHVATHVPDCFILSDGGGRLADAPRISVPGPSATLYRPRV